MKIANPVKAFNYTIELDGFDVATCQGFEIGEEEIAAVDHGDGNTDVYTAGKRKVPTISIENMVAEDFPNNPWAAWMEECQSIINGGGNLPILYKRTFYAKLLGGLGQPVRIWLVEGGWPTKMKPGKIGDKEDGNYMESATIRPDKVIPIL